MRIMPLQSDWLGFLPFDSCYRASFKGVSAAAASRRTPLNADPLGGTE